MRQIQRAKQLAVACVLGLACGPRGGEDTSPPGPDSVPSQAVSVTGKETSANLLNMYLVSSQAITGALATLVICDPLLGKELSEPFASTLQKNMVVDTLVFDAACADHTQKRTTSARAMIMKVVRLNNVFPDSATIEARVNDGIHSWREVAVFYGRSGSGTFRIVVDEIQILN